MSWLSKATGIHINLKPLAPIIGGAVGSIIPGVGTALGAGLGSFLNGVGNGQSVGKSALAGLASGAGGAVLGKLGGLASKIPGVGSAVGAAQGLGHTLEGIPGVSSLENILKQAGGKIPGMLSDALSHPLETAGVISGALDQAKARGLQTEAINAARAGYDSRAPLRAKGMAGLLNPTAPDLSGIDYGSSGSVYGKKIRGVA